MARAHAHAQPMMNASRRAYRRRPNEKRPRSTKLSGHQSKATWWSNQAKIRHRHNEGETDQYWVIHKVAYCLLVIQSVHTSTRWVWGIKALDLAYSSGILSCHQHITQTTKNYCFFFLHYWEILRKDKDVCSQMLRIVVMGPHYIPVRVPKTLILKFHKGYVG